MLQLRRSLYICSLLMLTLSFLSPSTINARISNSSFRQQALADFPTVDPNYIYNQLFYMVTHFQHREAGYDNNLPVGVNEHDEFAAYWSQEMMHDLQGFGPQQRRDNFTIRGWQGRPATVPAFNVEVSVPGVTHPEQVVVIGCHYDGEAVSTQSAYDDASGCAIELGVAQALGAYWQSHHVYPARTLRFVIFDAEEQGLYGSYHYVNSTVNGDLQNIVAMFNEEQNGIAYPLRYLGKANNPFLPFYVFMTPLQKSDIYPDGNKLSQQQKSNISRFRALMQQAIPAVFAQFRNMGFQALTYHTDNKQDVPQQIFTPDQLKNVQQGDDVLGASDQVPFTMAGLPCVTMAGNFDGGPNGTPTPDHPAYPFDTSVDTIQLMNTFADGSSRQSQALTLALSLPAMITTWMLNQSDILGQAPAGQNPIATISDIGQTVVGQNITLDARASLSPSNSALSYTWDFGDGTKASGISVDHTYTTAKNYTLSMTVSSSQGTSTIRKTINVVAQPLNYDNPYIGFQPTGNVPLNPANILPQPDDSLSDNVLPKSLAQTSSPKTTGVTPTISTSGNINQSANPPIALFIGAGVVVLLLLLVIGIWIGIRHRKANV